MCSRLTRLELGLVAAIFAIGFGLRAAAPSRMAVEHFDEGVYASNLYTPEGRYPFQHLYAPPLLPFCLEWAAIFGGPGAVMWVNVVSGSLTLLVLWGMVRAWWGPAEAIAALTLLALNEFHIAYSRAALTDAMLGLWMTAGVWAGWRAIQFGGAGNIALAGVLASLAWWTKYNGWLTLAITGAGTAGWILFGGARAAASASGGHRPTEAPPPQARSKKRAKSSAGLHPPIAPAPKTGTVFGALRVYLGRWALTAGIAFLLWAPWLWELQQFGGYAAVAKNHAGYFTGLGEWWGNAVQQMAAAAHYGHWLTRLGVVAAAVAGIAVTAVEFVTRWKQDRLTTEDLEEPPRGQARRWLSLWMGASWLIGLSVAIPLYHPYPRLAVPWWIAASLGMAGLFWLPGDPDRTHRPVTVASLPEKPSAVGASFSWRAIVAGVVVVLLHYQVLTSSRSTLDAWQERSSLREVAGSIVERLPAASLQPDAGGVGCALFVVAEPGLYFHLASMQRDSSAGHVTLPAASFDMARANAPAMEVPAYVVAGPHAERAEADRLIAEGRLEPVAEFEYRPSDLVLLDGQPAWELPAKDKPVVERVRLLHVKP